MKHISEYRNTDPAIKESEIMTGVKVIDERGGLQPGRITALCGPTISFKSTLAMNMAVNAAKAGVPTLFFSTERFADDVVKHFAKISEDSPDYPIMIDDEVDDFDILLCTIAVACHKESCPVRFVVIDNIEMIGVNGGLKLEDQPRKLKKLALMTGAHILFTARVPKSRDETTSRIPRERYIAADSVLSLTRTTKSIVRVCFEKDCLKDWTGCCAMEYDDGKMLNV